MRMGSFSPRPQQQQEAQREKERKPREKEVVQLFLLAFIAARRFGPFSKRVAYVNKGGKEGGKSIIINRYNRFFIIIII